MTQKDDPTIKEALDGAANAIKRGDLETGKAILRWVLEREPNNVLAWLWISRCAPTNEAKLECFNRVLAIDPSNKHALEGIQRFGGMTPSDVPAVSGKGNSGAASDLGTAKSGEMKWLVFAVLGIAVIIVGGVIAYTLLQPQQEPQTEVSTASAESQQLEDQVMEEATILPLSEVDLDSLLFISGDLPTIFVGQQIASRPPPDIGSVPVAEKAANQKFRAGEFASDGITVLLYESPADLERAYGIVLDIMSEDNRATPLGQVGEKAMLTEERMSGIQTAGVSIPSSTSANVVFTRCHALVYIDLFSSEADSEVAAEYAKRIDQRLQPLVCR